MFTTRFEILFNEADLIKVMKVLGKYGIASGMNGRLRTANCGWAKAPDCWFAFITCKKKQWYDIITDLLKEGVELLPEDTGR